MSADRASPGDGAFAPPQPDDPQEWVWRYMDLAKFVDVLACRRLHLARVDRFDDPFEATMPRAAHRDAQRLAWFRDARRTLYASCWRLGREENEAMWRLYCGNAGGIAIVTTYERLAAHARGQGCAIGVVRYLDYARETFGPGGDVLIASMHKRIAFAHEREVRIVKTTDPHETLSDGRFALSFDPESLLERVVVSPLSEPYFREAARTIAETFAPALLERFTDSAMSEEPVG